MTDNALYERIVAALPTLHGWCSPEKARKLASYVRAEKPEVVVEIGVFGGSSLIPQVLALEFNKAGMAYGIDPWSREAALEEMVSPENRKWWSEVDIESIYRHCQNALERFGVENRCELIRDKAENVVERFADESIGLLHIDGNHSEALSYKDATLYLPKVKPGGVVFFDDIWWQDGGDDATTRRAILYLGEHCTRLELVGDCMILRKNP